MPPTDLSTLTDEQLRAEERRYLPLEDWTDDELAAQERVLQASAEAQAANPDLTAGETLRAAASGAAEGLRVAGQKMLESPPVRAAAEIANDPLVANLTRGNPIVRETAAALPYVPAAGLRATGTVAGAIAGSPGGPVGTGVGAAAGYSAFDSLAQQLEVLLGQRAEYSNKENLKGAVATGIGFGLPMPSPVIAPGLNVARQSAAATTVGATAEKAGQVLTGENDPDAVRNTALFTAALGFMGGLIQNAQTAPQRARVIQAARDLGYTGNSFGGVRAWWKAREADIKLATMKRAEPATAETPAGQIPARGEAPGAAAAAPETAPVAPAPEAIVPAPAAPAVRAPEAAPLPAPLPPVAPVGQPPAAQGVSPTPNASLTSRGSPTPGVEGEAPSVAPAPAEVKPPTPSAEPVEATTQIAYTFSGRRVKIPADQAPAANQVTADQYAELAQVRKTKGDAAYRRAWDRTIKANKRLAAAAAKNATAREGDTAAKGKRLQFKPRPDGQVDIIDAIQDLGGVPKPGPERGGQFDGWEDAFRGPARVLVGKRQGGWDGFMQDLVATYPQFANLEGAYAEQIGVEVGKALDARRQLDRMQTQERATEIFQKAALTGKGRAPKEPKAGEPEDTDSLVTADKFEVKGQDFKVKEIDESGNVIVEDGPRFGTQVLPPGSQFYPDKGSLKRAERPAEGDAMDWPEPETAPAVAPTGGELFDTAGSFNLASETQTAPSAPAVPAAQTDEMFGAGEVRSTAPTALDRANERARGTSGTGMPVPRGLEAGMPPLPPGTPAGAINYGKMPVAMERVAPGTVDVPTVLAALQDVAKATGITTDIREGRFYHNALGIAKSWSEIIRVRQLNDLPTAAHEIAHIVSKAIFGSMKSKPLIQAMGRGPAAKELTALGKALYGSTKPTAGYTAEGFSELVRLWLSTDDAAKQAPRATAWMEGALFAQHPEMAQALRRARDLYDLWRAQGAEGRVAAQTKDEPGRLSRVRDWAKKNLTKRAVVEEFAPLEELAKAYQASTGNRLAAGSNPYLIASALRSTAGARLETWVERGMTDLTGTITGPSLREAVARVKPQDAERFQLYLTVMEAIERHKQGKNPGIAAEDAVYVRDKFAREHPEFIGAADRVAAWWDGVLQYLVDAYPEMNGPIVERIRRANPKYYGPLARVTDAEKVRGSMAEATGGGLKRFSGSGRPIKKIILQSLLVAEGMIAKAHRDAVLRSVVRLADTEGMGWVIEEVPRSRVMERVSLSQIKGQLERMGVDTTDLDPDALLEYASVRDMPAGMDPIIAVRTGGGTRWFQVPAQVFEILEGVQEPARLGPLFEIFAGMPNRAFKLGTTGLRASFSLVTNPIRDLPTFMLQSIAGNPAERAKAYLGAMFNIVRSGLGGNESAAQQLAAQLGLQSSTFLGGDIEQARREARALFHGRMFRRLRSPVETLREVLSFTETAPRLAELEMIAREMGWRPGMNLTPDQAISMMLAFKRVTTDFTAKGSQWRPLYRAVPFLGAGTQGARAGARAFKGDKGTKQQSRAALRVILNGLTMLTVPALFNWWRNKDEEWWQNLPWRERYLYLNVADGPRVYQIPLPPEWGAAFVTAPTAVLDGWYRRDPEAVTKAMGHIFSVVNPLDWPVLLKTGKEQWQNRVEFFDRPIVPRGELDLLPGAQRNQYTSELAQLLGNAFPEQISPRRVDAAVRQVYGGLGGDVMDTPGAIMRALGLETQAPEREFEGADIPVLGRVVRRGGKYSANSQPVIDFWDDYLRYSAWSAANKKAQKDGRPPLQPMSRAEQAYAIRLEVQQPVIKMTMDMAARTPEYERRQKLYQAVAKRARDIVRQRPE